MHLEKRSQLNQRWQWYSMIDFLQLRPRSQLFFFFFVCFFVTDEMGKTSANGVVPLNQVLSWDSQLLISVEEEDVQPVYRIIKKGEVIQTLDIKATLCMVLIKILGLLQSVRYNVRANYKQNSLRHNNVMCWKLVYWCKHVCNAMVLPSHWSYIKRRWSGRGRGAIHPVTRHCSINMMLKLLF